MKFLCLLFLFMASEVYTQTGKVYVTHNAEGKKLIVDGRPFMVHGVNWDYVPIGDGILDKSIWGQKDHVIEEALDAEMTMLKNMGGNAIRTYAIQPKWIEYICGNYGIYTMINTTFGAYGLTVNGRWKPQTDYTDEATRRELLREVREMAHKYKDTPGLLLYMIGNENNYHLFWEGAETGTIPTRDGGSSKRMAARGLYRTINDAAKEIKAIDPLHPVAICNGDLLYLDIIKEECGDIDIYGTNMYRGISFGNAFQQVKDELDLPILFAEFGADAFNVKDNEEDQYSQAYYNLGNWKEIYLNAAGLGKAENAIGGFTFQFSDGWWKYKQTEDLEVHNTAATWANNGYSRDQLNPDDNNMNEEWFGICAKGPTDQRGLYKLVPRAAYFALKEAHGINPYEPGITMETIKVYLDGIDIGNAVLKAK